jgi:hypothetical protein
MSDDNSFGTPLPEGWTAPPRPVRAVMEGRLVRLEPLVVAHAEDLHAANLVDPEGRNWDYLPYGPFDSLGAYRDWVGSMTRDGDPMFYAVVQQGDGRAVGVASLMRINPASGSIEVAFAAAQARRDRGDVSDDEMGVHCRLPPLRVEMQRAEPALAQCCHAAGVVL